MKEPMDCPTQHQVPAPDCRPPIISIGMPVYNGGRYIREALESLVTQTWSDFELIISDNASTDGTQAICHEYAQRDQRIRYFCQDQNKGAVANFQFVLDMAKGTYFMWAAADDRWDNQWIELLLAAIEKQSGFAAFGDLVHIDADSACFPHPASAANLQFTGKPLRRKLAFFLAYEGLGKANLFYALYPRSALQRISLSDYSFDYQTLFALLDHIAYVHVNGACLYKRIHDHPATRIACAKQSLLPSAPFKVVGRDWLAATHYLPTAGMGLRIALLLLTPLKLMAAVRYHVRRKVALLCSGSGAR